MQMERSGCLSVDGWLGGAKKERVARGVKSVTRVEGGRAICYSTTRRALTASKKRNNYFKRVRLDLFAYHFCGL